MHRIRSATTPSLPPLTTCKLFLGAALCVLAAMAAVHTHALAQSPAPVPLPATNASAPGRPTPVAAAPSASQSRAAKQAAESARVTKPTWVELTPPQQQALAPLAGSWTRMSEAQKRKWLAMTKNYALMAHSEQAKLHSRMTEWVALSPAERTQARLNFAETKELSPDDKKAKWEAYQALPSEEKKKFAATAAKPPPTAPALKPASVPKLAEVPKTKPDAKSPRIAAAPGQIDHHTLLPQSVPSPAAPPQN